MFISWQLISGAQQLISGAQFLAHLVEIKIKEEFLHQNSIQNVRTRTNITDLPQVD